MKKMTPIVLLLPLFFSFFIPSPALFANPKEAIETLMMEIPPEEDFEYGLLLQDLNSGEILYSKNPEMLLNPASNTKIMTSLAALQLLGPDFTFKTQLLAQPSPEPSVLHALTLKGFGDPTFNSVQLQAMVQQLKERGIRKIDQVWVDGSYFDGESFPGQFDGRQKDAFFNCSVGALSIDHNLLELVVSAGEDKAKEAKVEIKPPLPLLPLETKVSLGGKKGRIIVKNKSASDEELGVSVTGSMAAKAESQSFKLSIHHPSRLAGMRLLQALRDEGIEAPPQASYGAAPFGSLPFAEASSPPLLTILQEMNKNSDNFIAEQLTKFLGAKFAGAPGSTEKGTAVILKKLQDMGVGTQGATLENGSGLSKINRVSAHMLAQVLYKAYKDAKLQQNFFSTLSILGVDGTLKRKFRNSDIAGRFVGKTGTLNGVSSLSGYLFPKGSESNKPAYIYAYILNGKGKDFWKQKQVFQDILELLLST